MPEIFTKYNCVQCKFTKKFLDDNGVEYKITNVDDDELALERIRELGYLAAPVVITENDSWAGFQPDKLRTLL